MIRALVCGLESRCTCSPQRSSSIASCKIVLDAGQITGWDRRKWHKTTLGYGAAPNASAGCCLAEFDRHDFRMVALRAFESSHVMTGLVVRLDTRKPHLGPAL